MVPERSLKNRLKQALNSAETPDEKLEHFNALLTENQVAANTFWGSDVSISEGITSSSYTNVVLTEDPLASLSMEGFDLSTLDMQTLPAQPIPQTADLD